MDANASDTPPRDTYEAAAWLRRRHAWLDTLLTRVTGPSGDEYAAWLDELVDAFNDIAVTDEAWQGYQRSHPEPQDENAWETWQAAGPQLRTPAAEALAPMSGGEIRMLRLLTTFGTGPRCSAGWRIDDVDFDDRGAAVVEDWIKILRSQLPALQR